VTKKCNKLIRKKYDKKYSQTDKFKKTQKKYRESESGKEVPLRWYYNNKERALEIQRKYRSTKKGREKDRRYHNSEKGQKLYKKMYKKRKFSIIISNNIRKSLKGNKNGQHWEDIVGYTLNELKQHLQSQFQEGMSWDNHGKWHIDHIRPIASFNITDYKCEDFKECWSLSNLQPLWAIDNIRKGDKWDD